MLQNIRNKTQGIVVYTIVILIAVTFALWGVDALIGNMGSHSGLAEVNGEMIDRHEVERNSQIYIQEIIANNPNIDVDSLNADEIRQNVLSDLINRKLIEQASDEFDLAVSDDKVETFIVKYPYFADANGKFNLDNYRAALRNMGQTPVRFRETVKRQLLAQQLLSGIQDSTFVLENEVTDLAYLINQKRSFRYLDLENARLKDKINITDEEIADFYRKNKSRYLSDEKVEVNYVIFDPKSLEAEFEPSEEDYKNEYEKYKISLIASDTKRRVAQILIKFDDDAEKRLAFDRLTKLKEEAKSGADFTKLAQENSMDIATANKGGDLGFTDLYEISPLFAAEAGKLNNVGDLSEIVETKYGLHLIKLLEIEKPEFKSLAEVKPELRKNFMDAPLRSKTTEILEELKNLSFSEDKLENLAKTVKLEVKSSGWLNKQELSGIWSQDSVKPVLFSPEIVTDSSISAPIKLLDNKYVLFQKTNYEPERERELSEVSAEVKADLTKKTLSELNKKEAEDLIKNLKEGKSLELDWKMVTNSDRQNRGVKPEIISDVFGMNPSNLPAFKLVDLYNGDLALVELLKVEAEPKVLETEIALLGQELERRASDTDVNNFLLSLRDSAKVIIN